jgi:hypothetical protein
MPVIINGSTGISGTDGSAANPAIQGTDPNTGIFFPAPDTIALSEGGVEGMRLDSSGNMSVAGTLTVGGASAVAAAPTAAGNVVFTTNGTTWSSTAKIVLGTAVASTSGTSIDFTGIPSWAKRITVMFNGVSTNGTSGLQIQIGSGSFVASGYASQSSAGTTTSGAVTSGFSIIAFAVAANTYSGAVTINLVGSNTWCGSSILSTTNTSTTVYLGAGNSPALSGALDRVRITTVNGTDTFDAGTINIMYE